jgi:predicted enzyme related to lactoylglutathione lyase
VNNLDDAQTLIESLGGSLKKRNTLDNGFEWRVMTDPEDNEFCIFVEG